MIYWLPIWMIEPRNGVISVGHLNTSASRAFKDVIRVSIIYKIYTTYLQATLAQFLVIS